MSCRRATPPRHALRLADRELAPAVVHEHGRALSVVRQPRCPRQLLPFFGVDVGVQVPTTAVLGGFS